MKKILFLFLLLSSTAFAQRNLNIEETVFGARTYAVQNLLNTAWIPESNTFTYLDATYQNLMQRSASTSWKEEVLISKVDLEKIVKEKFSGKEISLRIFPYDYVWTDKQSIRFTVETETSTLYVHYATHTKSITDFIEVSNHGSNQELTSDYSKSAYLVGQNIFITDQQGKITEVTSDTIDGIVNGSDYTHRQEFGINKGMWWNDQNDKLLYYRKDETMVTNYPIIQWEERVATVKNIRYPMAGMKSEEVTLVIYDTKTNQKITLQTGEPKEQYLTAVTWDPSGEFVYVGVLNRAQNHLKLNQYAVKDGSFVKTLFEEKSTTWVEPQHPLLFSPKNKNEFVYLSDRNGYNQLYLFNTNGKLVRSLGFEQTVVADFIGFTANGQSVLYSGVTNKGLDRQLFEVNLTTGKTKQLTKDAGMHSAKLNSSGTYVLDQFSNLTTPNNIQVLDVKKGTSTEILIAENPFIGKINNPRIEFVELQSADAATPLTGRIIYPTDFDPNKKYPVMYYLYGGSHSQLVSNRWLGGAGYFDLYMAQQGYVVFTMDNRGTDARGKAFASATHRQLGQAEMQDQLTGIEFLKSKSFVDQSNLGIFGWSFGGFMTTSFMVHHPDIFKAAVAGGPVIDWKYYEVMYGERYMDTPEENPEGYKLTSLEDKADRLKGRLLIIHGAQDPVVVQQNSMQFIQSAIKAGKQVDYFLYPSHEHNVSGKDRVHMYQKIADYFDNYLKN